MFIILHFETMVIFFFVNVFTFITDKASEAPSCPTAAAGWCRARTREHRGWKGAEPRLGRWLQEPVVLFVQKKVAENQRQRVDAV